MSDYKLIGQDCTIQMWYGQIQDGEEPVYLGVAANQLPTVAFANSIKISRKANVVDLHAINDKRAKKRFTYRDATIVVDLRVDPGASYGVSGYLPIEVGQNGAVAFRTDSTAPVQLFTGVWVSNDVDSPTDNAQSQSYTLKGKFVQ
jgi:hypothetical protein